MKFTENKIVSVLRHYDYKLTPQRRAVLKIISHSKDHLTPYEIYNKVHEEFPNIGLVTVYRTLEMLSRLNLICKIHMDDNCQSYLLRRDTLHHHHLICTNCGTVKDLISCDLGELEKKLTAETGFKVNSHLLEFQGICPECRKKA